MFAGSASSADCRSSSENSGILKGPGQIGVVGGEVEVAVAAEAEQDRALLARLLGRRGLLDRRADRVRGLGRGDDALGAGELDGRLERLVLAVGARLDRRPP